MAEDFARVLSSASNIAVVQLPGRRFPGSVIQGDTLHAMVAMVRDIQRHARETSPDGHEIHDEIAELAQNLQSRLSHYEAVLAEQQIERPV